MAEPSRLAGRFRAIARERIERIGNALVELRNRPGAPELVELVKRELHTLKGEARMTGFREVSDATHQLEELLRDLGSEVPPDLLFSGLDVVGALIGSEPGAEGLAARVGALAGQVANLRAEVRGTPAPAPASVPAGSAVRVATPTAGTVSPAPTPAPTAPTAPAAPSAPPAAPRPAPAAPLAAPGEALLRVELSRLDRVTESASDIVLAHQRSQRALVALRDRIGRLADGSQLLAAAAREDPRLLALAQAQALALADLEAAIRAAEEDAFDRELQVLELDDRVRELRFLPLSTLFARFPRAVHDIAREQGREVRLEIRGGTVEMDKGVIDRIAEPLLHLLRNALDHGVEAPAERARAGKPAVAAIELSATSTGGSVEIVVRDDGGGIDPAKVRAATVRARILTEAQAAALDDAEVIAYVFSSGLSTRTEVTELSGRGVGLAVVKDTVEALGGSAVVRSVLGRSTVFVLRVPVSVVLARVLIVVQDGQRFAVPCDVVRGAAHIPGSQVEPNGRGLRFRHEGGSTPLVDLGSALGRARTRSGDLVALLVEHRDREYGLVVDAFGGQLQVIQRPLDPFISGLRLYHGTVAASDGELALLLDVPEVLRRALQERQPTAEPTSSEATTRRTVLVVDDSEFTRDLVVAVLRDLDFDVVEAVNGRQGLDRFRDARPVLVLTDLDMPVLDGFGLVKQLRATPEGRHVPIVVFTTRGSEEDKQRAAALGADAYVVKTEFRESKLTEIVERLLSLPRATGP